MKSDSLSLKVYTEIRKNILSNQLLPNTRLKEDEWASKLTVSRIAVREALNRLLGERLVSVGEKGGYFVSGLSQSDVLAIRELREILEMGALTLLIKKNEKSKIAKLEKICDDFTNMFQNGYLGGACEADVRFHETIIEFAENDKLLQLYKLSHIPIFHQQLMKSHELMADYEQTDLEHRNIVNALKQNNLELAKQWLEKHLSRGENAMLQHA
ncbi:MAG: GntR family transcriptional regulator [Cytophagia bacterium]|nr:MAG: GntR family transcriptional regulator [Cytophagales bacterium]TAG37666.1 MAG: GntR family transcriptional regulator [Cytophagia bacterium]TAG78806.1 MAG: GntR family transcriptional regulator [Cytophagales bacterium]